MCEKPRKERIAVNCTLDDLPFLVLQAINEMIHSVPILWVYKHSFV